MPTNDPGRARAVSPLPQGTGTRDGGGESRLSDAVLKGDINWFAWCLLCAEAVDIIEKSTATMSAQEYWRLLEELKE